MKSLVKRAQRGDDQAFVELIEENKQAMYKVAVGILKNDFGAEDAKGKKAEEKIAAPPGAATINEDFLELLDQMEQQYRVVLILYYVEEMSIREISQILQMNENTVKTRLSRGRGVYKKLYLKEHPEFQFE